MKKYNSIDLFQLRVSLKIGQEVVICFRLLYVKRFYLYSYLDWAVQDTKAAVEKQIHVFCDVKTTSGEVLKRTVFNMEFEVHIQTLGFSGINLDRIHLHGKRRKVLVSAAEEFNLISEGIGIFSP